MFADDASDPTYKVKGYRNVVAAVPIKQTNHNNNMPWILEAVPIAPAPIFAAQNAADCVKKSGNTQSIPAIFALSATFLTRKSEYFVYWYGFLYYNGANPGWVSACILQSAMVNYP